MSWANLMSSGRKAAHRLLGGVSVTAGAISGDGLLNQNTETNLAEHGLSIEYTLTCETALFGGLQHGSGIVVDGAGYIVRHEALRVGDGSDCLLMLQKVDEGVGTVPPTIIAGPAAGIPQTVVIPLPGIGDDFPLFLTRTKVTLTEVRAVIRSAVSPSVTIRIGYSAGIEDAITQWATDELVVTNQSGGQLAVITNMPIPVGQQVRIVVSGVSGGVATDLTVYMRGVVAQ